MSERIYAWDKREGQIVYRIAGKQHGDGQADSEESPVWLLAEDQELDHYDELPDVTTD